MTATWASVNDNQNPNWQGVNDQQVNSWSIVSSSGFILLETGVKDFLLQESGSSPTRLQLNQPQIVDWQVVDDQQAENWQGVNDANTVVWVSIPT